MRKKDRFTTLLAWLLLWKSETEIPVGWIHEKEWDIWENWTRTSTPSTDNILQHQMGSNVMIPTGNLAECFYLEYIRVCRNRELLLSGKLRNRKVKMEHGNGKMRQNISVLHWNMGPKFWPKKVTEIEPVIQQYCPDIYVISESNLLESVTAENRNIAGYRMILPRTSEVQKISRIVILVRQGVEVEVLRQHMDTTVAAIWVKVTTSGRKSLIIGAIYREHQFICQDQPTDSDTDQRQLERWRLFVDTWRRISRDN